MTGDLDALLERLRMLSRAQSRAQESQISAVCYVRSASGRLGAVVARAIVTILITLGALVVLSVVLDAVR